MERVPLAVLAQQAGELRRQELDAAWAMPSLWSHEYAEAAERRRAELVRAGFGDELQARRREIGAHVTAVATAAVTPADVDEMIRALGPDVSSYVPRHEAIEHLALAASYAADLAVLAVFAGHVGLDADETVTRLLLEPWSAVRRALSASTGPAPGSTATASASGWSSARMPA